MVNERKMNVKKKLQYCMPLLLAGLALCMSGCSYRLDYTEEEKEVIVDYAAAVVMKQDENLYDRYLYELDTERTTAETTTSEPETTASVSDEQNSDTSQDVQNETTEQAADTELTVATSKKLTDALGLHGLTAEYLDYAVTPQYPYENIDGAAFVMKAVKGTNLLSVKFRISNQAGKDIAINMMDPDRRYVAVLNDGTQVNVQLSLLLDALNTFEGTLKPGESKELVLVYQVKLNSKDDIKHLDIIFADDEGTETKIRLK